MIKSKVSKNTVNQTILYSYKGMVLQFEIIIRDDGSVVIKDVKPVQDSPIRRPIPKPKLLGTFKSDCYARARVPGEGFTIKKPVKVIIDSTAAKKLKEILKKENLSPARQQTLINKAISMPDEVIKSKVNKNTLNQIIAYDYKGTRLIMNVTISDKSVALKDIKAEKK